MTIAEPASTEHMTVRQVVGRRRCAICQHPDKWRLELLRAGGASLDSLAAKFNVSRDQIHNHWTKHVTAESKATYLCGPAEMATLAQKAAVEGDSVLDYFRMCRSTLVTQLAAMNEAGDARGAGYITGQLVKVLEAMARVTGELSTLASLHLHQNNTVNNIAASSEYLGLRTAVLQALRKHPEARADVLHAIHRLAPQAPVASPQAVLGPVVDITPEVAHG
jgi:hypothetical protein